MTPKSNLIIGLIIAIVVAASYNIDANPVDFVEGLPNLAIIAEELTEIEPKLFETAFYSMFETIQMAFIGTIVGVAIALPLSMFAARNLNSKWVYAPV